MLSSTVLIILLGNDCSNSPYEIDQLEINVVHHVVHYDCVQSKLRQLPLQLLWRQGVEMHCQFVYKLLSFLRRSSRRQEKLVGVLPYVV